VKGRYDSSYGFVVMESSTFAISGRMKDRLARYGVSLKRGRKGTGPYGHWFV
jgi:hypothetical protein